MEELDQAAIDSAIILENRIQERVHAIVRQEIDKVVVNVIGKVFKQQQEAMMMEIAIKVGQILRETDREQRKPLWDSKPEDFGMTANDLNKHMLGKDIDNALHKVP